MNILVLGGYGLIGAAVVQRLLAAGHVVTGLGRTTDAAARMLPAARWVAADLATLGTPEAWTALLAETAPEGIVNCAGVLQDGARDRVDAVQSAAIRALVAAAPKAGVSRFVQISATRATPVAETAFMRSKGEADAAVQESALQWTILRPGLVLAPQAYGGTALLRAIAAMPMLMPMVHADATVRTVAVEDVADAVVRVVAGEVPSHRAYDLVSDEAQTLADVARGLRGWLGLAPVPIVAAPRLAARGVATIADGLSLLGWRSPFRSTAMTELSAGIDGDPAPWRAAAGQPLASLAQTLARMPSTVQERWFARLFLLKPLVLATLAAFWIVTGLVTLADLEAASAVLAERGIGPLMAEAIAFVGSVVDIGLGVAVLVRRWMPAAALGMVCVTLGYLAGATLLAADLWTDPLGPLVKAVPAMMLAIVALALAEDR